jgi:dUTPase
MGQLAAGDWVLDQEGCPTPVIATTETMLHRQCRTIEFSDGTEVIADVQHLWPVSGPGGSRRIITTGGIERALRHRPAAERAHPTRRGNMLNSPKLHGESRVGLLTRNSVHESPSRPAGDQVGRSSTLARSPAVTQSPSPARTVTAVRRCQSVPVRCIQVAAPNGIFLITRSFIPTHNSSLGRLGLIVHATAGFCDPGWKGTLTLELNNLTRVPIKLYPGLLIAQLSFMALDRPALRPYGSPELGSHYQGQEAATESRYEGSGDRGPVRGAPDGNPIG